MPTLPPPPPSKGEPSPDAKVQPNELLLGIGSWARDSGDIPRDNRQHLKADEGGVHTQTNALIDGKSKFYSNRLSVLILEFWKCQRLIDLLQVRLLVIHVAIHLCCSATLWRIPIPGLPRNGNE
jgi:hypothetical protein